MFLTVPKIIRSKRRTLALQILPDSSILVKAPQRVSEKDIQKFIEKNSEWIEKQRKIRERTPKTFNRTYQHGEEFLYLGIPHTLDIGNYKAIETQSNKLLFPNFLHFRIQKELTNWYIAKAREIITQQVERYAKEMEVSYTSLTFSDTKSRWGSCSHDNQLQFNWRLIMTSLLTINYVVVHELTHIQHKDHSQKFWSKVRLFAPSYRQQRKWLKEHGDGLLV